MKKICHPFCLIGFFPYFYLVNEIAVIKNQKPEGILPHLALLDSIWRLKYKFYTNETLMNLHSQKAMYKSMRVPHGSKIKILIS